MDEQSIHLKAIYVNERPEHARNDASIVLVPGPKHVNCFPSPHYPPGISKQSRILAEVVCGGSRGRIEREYTSTTKYFQLHTLGIFYSKLSGFVRRFPYSVKRLSRAVRYGEKEEHVSTIRPVCCLKASCQQSRRLGVVICTLYEVEFRKIERGASPAGLKPS